MGKLAQITIKTMTLLFEVSANFCLEPSILPTLIIIIRFVTAQKLWCRSEIIELIKLMSEYEYIN